MKWKNSSKSPASIDELVKFISKTVRDHYKKTGQRTDGSMLAYIIRSEYPDIDYFNLGLTRLGDVVRIAEKSGLVSRYREVNHLELLPPDATQKAGPNTETKEVTERRYVRNDIWRAFIFRSRSKKFLLRESLEITEVPEEDKKEISTIRRNHHYCEIERIPEDEQISWAKQYISSFSNIGESSDAEASALLFAKVNKYSATYIRSWKAYFSSKVTDYIRTWASDNEVQTDSILIPTKKRDELDLIENRPSGDVAIRRAIKAVIEDMPLSELDQVTLPVKYLRRHFTPK